MSKFIEIQLPINSDIDKFHTLDNINKIKVIKLGLLFIDKGNDHLQMWDNHQWQDKIDIINHKYNKEILQLKDTIQHLNDSHINYCNIQKKQQDNIINNAVLAEKTKYESEINSLNTRNISLMDKLHLLHESLEDKYNNRLTNIRMNCELKVKTIQDTLDSVRQKYEEQFARTQNSSLKGKDSEKYVYSKLNLMFPKADIEDTHSIPHRGDFIMRENDFIMMIETKNYSRNVTKNEIDKFYRDIDNPANSDLQCAVFLSQYTGICNKDDFCFEIRNDIPILFLHKLHDNYENLFLVVKFFKLIINQVNIDFKEKEILDSFKNVASTIKRNFTKQKSIVDKYHTQQIKLISDQQLNIADLYSILKVKF